jgi:tRNA (cytidine56-2'-O)-methyltransferase
MTARQFGADRIIYSGEEDSNMMESLEDVCDRWGGFFEVEYREDYRRVIKEFEGTTVHLTMYGLPFQDHVEEVKGSEEDLLLVAGSQKVPRDIYDLVDHNLAVGNQPHSEVTAVGVFLYELHDGAIKEEFPGAAIDVVPTDGKKKLEEQ